MAGKQCVFEGEAFQKEGKKGLGRGGSVPWLRDKCTLG